MGYFDRYNASFTDDFIGKTFVFVTNDGEAVVFEREDGKKFSLHHNQDCCEDVYVESIVGDLSDLEGVPMIRAEESSYDGAPPDGRTPESYTWTFYKFATRKGYVDIRFFGSSNGYYGESASLHAVN